MTLRKATFSAVRWTTTSAILRAGMQILQMALLARLLAPADFGLMALAGAAVAIALLFSDLGLSSALMHFPLPDRATLSTLFWLNLVFSWLLALLFAVSGWPLSILYEQPDLLAILVWLSVSFPIAALGQQFRVLAEKELRFSILAQNEIASAVTGTAVAVAAALAGWGVFALVAALLSTAAINSMLAWWRLSFGFYPQVFFNLQLARPFVVFGLHRVGDSFWNTARMQADVVAAGLFATPAAVAAYVVPRDLTLKIANTVINPVITRVGLPVMTLLQGDALALRQVYLKTLMLTASFNFPLYALLALFPQQIVSLLLGEQWTDADFYLRIFALWGLVRSTGNPSGGLLYAVGMARRAHIWNLMLFVATVPLLWLVARFGGMSALAWTMLGWQVAVYVLLWCFLIRPVCDVSFSAYNACMLPPLLCTALASVLAYATANLLPASLQLPIGSLVLAVAYMLLSWLCNRQWIEALAELLRIPLPSRKI
jgi:O-antigen/teichoic acid export membrane protein